MRAFPDESKLDKSEHSDDPIRGGSIGLNRILGRFVNRAALDRKPEFTAVLLNAFTIFRNVLGTYPKASVSEIETAFVKDITLFMDYYDAYLSFTKTGILRDKKCPIVVYFPDYRRVEIAFRRELTGQKLELFAQYSSFLKRFNGKDELVRDGEHCTCFWMRSGDATYPHKEVARKFRDLSSHSKSAYHNGDPIALLTHIPLDRHIASRLRNIHVLESHTGELKGTDQFKFVIDKEGRVPFNSVTHAVFGDSIFIKPMVTPKVRKALLEQAVKEKWISRSSDDIRTRIAKTANIPLRELQKIDFV